MVKGNTAQLSSSLNSYAEDSAYSDNNLLNKSLVHIGSICPKFPVAVWKPRMTPVMLGRSGIWAKALIEKMFASETP